MGSWPWFIVCHVWAHQSPVRAHGSACWSRAWRTEASAGLWPAGDGAGLWPAGDGTACAWLPSAPGSRSSGEHPALAAPCQTDRFLPLMNGLNSQQCNFLFSMHLDTGESKIYMEKYYFVWFCPVGFQTSYYIHEWTEPSNMSKAEIFSFGVEVLEWAWTEQNHNE